MIVLEGYKKVVDIWEGTGDVNFRSLKEGGIDGTAIRMNDTYGNIAFDTHFMTLWKAAKAAGMPRIPYVVISPWLTVAQYLGWISANLPAGCKAVALDIEISRPGYEVYFAAMVKSLCTGLTKLGITPVIYTGLWFIDCLASWPKDVLYWWARYPDAIQRPSGGQGNVTGTWSELWETVENYSWTPDPTGKCPGELVMWQFTSNWILPGSDGHAIDVNLMPREQFLKLFEMEAETATEPEAEVQPLRMQAAVALRIRSRPGISAPVVGLLEAGKAMAIMDVSVPVEAWVQIGEGQWVAASYAGVRYLSRV